MKKVITSARVTELGDIANRLSELYKKTTALQDDNFLSTHFSELEKQGKAITAAVKRDSVLSKLKEIDSRRDDAVRVLSKLLTGYENIPEQTLKPHGERLAAIFKKYGVRITDENYSSESNLIESLLADFATEEAVASVSALAGVSQALDNLRKEQNVFAEARAEYEKARSEWENQPTATSLRKPLLEIVNKKIIPYLIAMQIADNSKYGSFISAASKIIESVNDVIRGRGKK